MQLDLLYKGLPSAKADTRKVGVQIHSNAISFIQHEGRSGGEGASYTSPPSASLRPLPRVTAPPGDEGEKIWGNKGEVLVGDAPPHPSGPHHEGLSAQRWGAGGSPLPGSILFPTSRSFPGQKPKCGDFLLAGDAGQSCKQSTETLWFNAVWAAAVPPPPPPRHPALPPRWALPHPPLHRFHTKRISVRNNNNN